MNLILHVAKKDLRQTWLVLTAALAVFVLTCWILATPRQLQTPIVENADTLAIVAWIVSTGVLWQQETLPGERAYWFGRPLRWQHLLQAKALVVAVAIFVPILAVHAVIVSIHGFPVAAHLPALAWNAAMLVATYVLPVAVLSTITRNLQQLVLWALAISGAGIAATQAYRVPDDIYAFATTIVSALTIVALLIVLVWQFRTRSTRAGRIAVVGLTIVLHTLPLWVPEAFWYDLRRAFSAPHPARLAVDSNLARGLTIPIRVEGLTSGQSAEITSFHSVEVTAAGDRTAEATVITPPRGIDDPWPREATLRLPPHFAGRHHGQPLNISFLAELIVYDTPRVYPAAVGQTIEIPEYGRCLTWSDGYLRVQCQSLLGSGERMDGQFAVTETTAKRPLILRNTEAPSALAPRLFPITLPYGGSGGTSVYREGRVHISLRKPIANIQRRIELTGVRE